MRSVTLKSGEKVPVLGLGTWRMGERASERPAELKAVKLGLELGLRLVDTAEMYGEGKAEEIVGEAMGGLRDDIYLVSKVYPHNASRKGAIAACERSLKRLKTDRLDLYLLHWRGSHPLAETVEAFETLKQGRQDPQLGREQSRRRRHGRARRRARAAATARPTRCSITWARAASSGSSCPNARRPRSWSWPTRRWARARCCASRALKKIADKHGCDPAAVALAWVLRQPGVITIPKATKPEHVRANVHGPRRHARRGRPRRPRRRLPAPQARHLPRHDMIFCVPGSRRFSGGYPGSCREPYWDRGL